MPSFFLISNVVSTSLKELYTSYIIKVMLKICTKQLVMFWILFWMQCLLKWCY